MVTAPGAIVSSSSIIITLESDLVQNLVMTLGNPKLTNFGLLRGTFNLTVAPIGRYRTDLSKFPTKLHVPEPKQGVKMSLFKISAELLEPCEICQYRNAFHKERIGRLWSNAINQRAAFSTSPYG